MSIIALSHCGQYVALAEGTYVSIQRAVPQFQLRRFNVSQSIRKHLRPLRITEDHVNLRGLYWEDTETSGSTKLAITVSMDEFHAVLVYDIASSDTDPIVIESDMAIEHIDWLVGAPTEGSAYTNCTQLVIFDGLGLEARVYSLDCTKIVFTLPKPTTRRVLKRPKHPEFWSLISTPYYDKNSTVRSISTDLQTDNNPYLLHFTNDGSRSTLLASLELDFHPSSSAQILWDPSGSWICFFDPNESLFGYTLRVYNSLAIYKDNVDSLSHHRARPILFSNPDKGTGWICQWLSFDEALFVASIPTQTSQSFTIRLHGLSLLSVGYSVEVCFKQMENIWVYQALEGLPAFRRTDVCPETSFTWKEVHCSPKYLVLVSDSVVAILRRKCVDSVVKLEPEAYISSSQCREVQFVGDSVVVLSEQTLSIYEEESVRILATSSYIFSKVKVSEQLGASVFTLVEQTPHGETWRQVGLSGEDAEEEPSASILKSFPLNEDNSKVVNLVKEAQRRESQATRRRLTEDNDTFKFNMKRRRPSRPAEL